MPHAKGTVYSPFGMQHVFLYSINTKTKMEKKKQPHPLYEVTAIPTKQRIPLPVCDTAFLTDTVRQVYENERKIK